MSTEKIFRLAFEINGILGASFTSSIASSRAKLKQFSESTRRIRAEQRALERQFRQGRIDVDMYRTSMARLTGEISRIREEEAQLAAVMKQRIMLRNNFNNAIASAGTTIAIAGVIATPFIGAMKTAAEFQAKMSKVKAITSASNSEMEKLEQTAKNLGATTKFSASQAADAMSFLGQAGWNTNQIIAGMPGLLNLAAASGEDLAQTADIVSDDLTAFGLSADQAGHMADVFATVANRTNTDVARLGETMKYAAPVAKAFGASMEETSALAGLMANSGIKATQAGTALRAGFLRLAGPSEKAIKAMKEMGLSASDLSKQQGETKAALASLGIQMNNTSGPRKMGHIIKELAEKTKNMGKEQKLAMLKMIFGQEAASGWLAVIDQGPKKLNELTAQLEKCDGAANQMAETMQDNAQGAMIKLKSSMESVAIAIGSVFLPPVAKIGGILAQWTGSIASTAQKYPRLTAGIIYTATAVGTLIVAYKIAKAVEAGYALVKAMTLALLDREKIAFALNTAAQYKNIVAIKAAQVANFLWGAGAKSLIFIQGALNAVMLANPIGVVIIAIMALVAAGVYMYTHWKEITTFCSLMWHDPMAALAQFKEFIYSTFGGVFSWLSDKWENIKNIFSQPLSVTIKKVFSGDKPKAHATGGIFTTPHLGLVAEAGAEAIIPLADKNRGFSLWKKAGAILGADTNPKTTVTINIPVEIYGECKASTVEKLQSTIKKAVEEQVPRALANISNYRTRVSYD